MRETTNFNANWQFHEGADASLLSREKPGKTVRLPHNAVELPFTYFDEKSYQRAFTYQKTINYDASWDGKEVTLQFDGAMADSKVYLNGKHIASHPDGYTPFRVRLTGQLEEGANLITVTIDGSENPNIPPFGAMIDYLTYAGIYRDVWLEIAAPIRIGNVKIETPDALAEKKSAHAVIMLDNPQELALEGQVNATLKDAKGAVIAEASAEIAGQNLNINFDNLENIALWDLQNPALYTLSVALETPAGNDNHDVTFGFRDIAFKPEGFHLNGKRIQLRGLNRHQSFPYIGYALPRSAQERDAEIVKNDLGCNLVRSSHYPASPWFLDHCDRIGLLVFEELPGWQHIGDKDWQAASVKNVEAMITRDWNHPSIVTWGVRINESLDSFDFYAETNRVARELDSTRPTSGIRCYPEFDFQEDLYTMNDFFLGSEDSHNRGRMPLRSVDEITGFDHKVPYVVTEYNGHMYPTKSYDQEERMAEHARRHLDVVNAGYGDEWISGTIGWCAFDYNTHSDFGSGDRICHHGVMDMFREPKFAAFAYASQVDPSERVVLEPVTRWSLGERAIGGILPLMVLTNCDEVELHYGSRPPKRVKPDTATYPHLPHAPVIFTEEHFPIVEGGDWGGRWEDGLVIGYVNGEKVAEVKLAGAAVASELQVVADTNTIASEGDCVRVIVRALDQAGRKLPYIFESVQIQVEGAAGLIGPAIVPLRGGSAGFWLESKDVAGDIKVTVSCPQFEATTISLTAKA